MNTAETLDVVASPEQPGAGEVRHRSHRALSRRQVLGLAGKSAIGAAIVSAGGAAGYGLRGTGQPSPRVPVSAATPTGAAPRFASRPDLDPPRIQVVDLDAGASSGVVLVTPSLVPSARGVDEAEAIAEGKGQAGVMILDRRGELVWFQPTDGLATNLEVQQYRGQPVLTYWTGKIVDGIGYGKVVLLDGAYRTIATVTGGNGLQADLHDFTLTPQGTALVTAYTTRAADLRPVGGARHGMVQDGVVLEVDISTGRVLHEWHSLDHVGVDETYASLTAGAFDYFHLNSVSLDDDANLLVSARNTWTLYKVDRTTGEVVWRLGGKRSDFAMGAATNFEWQHHARRLADRRLTVFDDAATPAEETQSRALVLVVDEATRTVTLDRAYTHPAKLLASYEGSVQVLPDGHVFVGWGTEPYYTEFDASGSVVLDARYPTNVQSYRAFRSPWTGRPASAPAIAASRDLVGGLAVHASWNGATEVASWLVLAGDDPAALEPVATLAKAGFETAMSARTTARYVAVAALDATGHELATSTAVAA